jgi:hypothetical protein
LHLSQSDNKFSCKQAGGITINLLHSLPSRNKYTSNVFIWLKINYNLFGGGKGGEEEEGETHMTAISDIWRNTFFIVGTPFPAWLLGMVSDGSPLPLFKKKFQLAKICLVGFLLGFPFSFPLL